MTQRFYDLAYFENTLSYQLYHWKLFLEILNISLFLEKNGQPTLSVPCLVFSVWLSVLIFVKMLWIVQYIFQNCKLIFIYQMQFNSGTWLQRAFKDSECKLRQKKLTTKSFIQCQISIQFCRWLMMRT